MPRVSIIMATYNCADTLERSIDSMLAQTYQDWEFIICDDCSKDSSYDILKHYKAKYPEKFVILKNEVNSKLSFSLNRCLEMAKGEYIARMDGDDESLPERLERQVNFLDEHPEYAVVGVAMIPFDENGSRPVRYAKPIPVRRDLLKCPAFFHATILMRKEAYDAVGGYTVSKRTERAQDYDMWFRFFECGFKGYNIQEGLYRVLEDGKAMKRRTMRTRMYEVQTKILGYRRLHYPIYLYGYAFMPIIAALVPAGIMQQYHTARDKKSKNRKQKR